MTEELANKFRALMNPRGFLYTDSILADARKSPSLELLVSRYCRIDDQEQREFLILLMGVVRGELGRPK